MGKVVHNDVLDAALTEIATANGLCVNTAEPATRAAAISDNLMPEATPTFAANADGDVSGRKKGVLANNGNTADANGTATHVTLIDAVEALYVTTCTSQAITSGNMVNVGPWDIEIADPTP